MQAYEGKQLFFIYGFSVSCSTITFTFKIKIYWSSMVNQHYINENCNFFDGKATAINILHTTNSRITIENQYTVVV